MRHDLFFGLLRHGCKFLFAKNHLIYRLHKLRINSRFCRLLRLIFKVGMFCKHVCTERDSARDHHRALAIIRRLAPDERSEYHLHWTYWGITAAFGGKSRAHRAIALLDQLEIVARETHGARSLQVADWLGWKAYYSAWVIGREDEAVEDARVALDIRRTRLGPDNVLLSHYEVGRACLVANRWQEACEVFMHLENDWPKWKEDFPQPHFIGDVFGMHAVALRELGGDLTEAEVLARRSLSEYRAVYGEIHWVVALVLNEVAWFCRNRGAVLEAEALEDQAAQIRGQTKMWDHRSFVDRHEFVAEALLGVGRFNQAEQMLRDCVRCRAWMPRDHWALCRSAILLSRVLVEQGRLAEAEPFLLDNVAGLCEHPSAPAEHCEQAFETLARLYERWDASEPDAGYDEKAAEWRGKLVALDARRQPEEHP